MKSQKLKPISGEELLRGLVSCDSSWCIANLSLSSTHWKSVYFLNFLFFIIIAWNLGVKKLGTGWYWLCRLHDSLNGVSIRDQAKRRSLHIDS